MLGTETFVSPDRWFIQCLCKFSVCKNIKLIHSVNKVLQFWKYSPPSVIRRMCSPPPPHLPCFLSAAAWALAEKESLGVCCSFCLAVEDWILEWIILWKNPSYQKTIKHLPSRILLSHWSLTCWIFWYGWRSTVTRLDKKFVSFWLKQISSYAFLFSIFFFNLE